MSDAYSDSTQSAADGGLLTHDRLFKRLGEAASIGFVLVVGALIAWILASQVDFSLLRTVFPRFVDAFWLVVRIVVFSSLLSVTFGVFVGLGRISSSPLTSNIAKGYVDFFRGTPLLFQLFVIYYGIPRLFETFPFTDWGVPAAIIGLTLNHAAYVGEAIRGGINAVPEGQLEAARSLGMSKVQSMREVVLPQAWRNALAAIGNDQIILVKDTSLLTVIAVPEIMSVFRNINSNQLDPWTPLVWVCLFYLAITMSMSMLVSLFEERADWGGADDEQSAIGTLVRSLGAGFGRRK